MTNEQMVELIKDISSKLSTNPQKQYKEIQVLQKALTENSIKSFVEAMEKTLNQIIDEGDLGVWSSFQGITYSSESEADARTIMFILQGDVKSAALASRNILVPVLTVKYGLYENAYNITVRQTHMDAADDDRYPTGLLAIALQNCVRKYSLRDDKFGTSLLFEMTVQMDRLYDIVRQIVDLLNEVEKQK